MNPHPSMISNHNPYYSGGVPISNGSFSFESQAIFLAIDGMKQTLTTFESKYASILYFLKVLLRMRFVRNGKMVYFQCQVPKMSMNNSKYWD